MEEKKPYLKIITIVLFVLIGILFIWNIVLQCRLNSIDKKLTEEIERIESDVEDKHLENRSRMDDIEIDVDDNHLENEMRIDDNETRINDLEYQLGD